MEFQSAISYAISLLITLVVASFFYKWATFDLREAVGELKAETSKLQNLNRITLLALQNSGMADLNVDG